MDHFMSDATEISQDSQSSKELRKVILEKKPKVVLETGTYKGSGSSRIVLDALGLLLDNVVHFYTIEIRKEFWEEAVVNLNANRPNNVYVYCINGLSIPRNLLPDAKEIERLVAEAKEAKVQVDHNGTNEILHYTNETYLSEESKDRVIDNILSLKPDIILLDSGGHIGTIEFKYVLSKLSWPCTIYLDDTRHIKHYKSLEIMKNDDRFFVRIESSEKFGFTIVEFTP